MAFQPGELRGPVLPLRRRYLEPKAFSPEGPRLWFGGQRLRGPVLDRIVRYGHGFHPFGVPTEDELVELTTALEAAGRDANEVERIGGTRAIFPDDHSCADLGAAMAPIAEQLEQGFTTFCVKPSQFIDDPADMSRFLDEVIRRAESITAG